jgi:hypothetical protein
MKSKSPERYRPKISRRLSRRGLKEARRTIEEYAEALREIIKKLRRRMN